MDSKLSSIIPNSVTITTYNRQYKKAQKIMEIFNQL